MVRSLRLIVALCGLASLHAGHAARAGLVLDQSFIPSDSAGNVQIFNSGPDFFQELAQTFTVGLAGDLSAIDVHIAADLFSGPLLFDIRSVVGGVPQEADAPVLVSGTVAAADIIAANGSGVRDFFRIDFSGSAIPVLPGEMYAIVLRTSSPFLLSWTGAEEGYGGGSGFFRSSNQQPTWGGSFGDLGFKTFVEVSVVPEPSSLALAGIGTLALLGWCCRRTIRAGGEGDDSKPAVSSKPAYRPSG